MPTEKGQGTTTRPGLYEGEGVDLHSVAGRNHPALVVSKLAFPASSWMTPHSKNIRGGERPYMLVDNLPFRKPDS